MEETFRLITNIQCVDFPMNDINARMRCNAILLEKYRITPQEIRTQIRTFGTNSAWPVFSHFLRCDPLEYVAQTPQGNILMLGSDADPKPLLTGAVLLFKDRTKISLVAENPEKPIDVEDFQSHPEVWVALENKVRTYWTGQTFPVLEYRQHKPTQ